jgi:REP element-mobilizing transposase RayT
MANTYSSLYYHGIFSTKNRFPWIRLEIEQRVWAYIGGIARKHQMTALQIGGVEDHIHGLIMAPPTIAPCNIAKFLKGESSLWIHDEFPWLNRFAWQDGYAALAVSKSDLPDVVRYIENQREHHRRKTFQEEYLHLLEVNEIEYDLRYVWG